MEGAQARRARLNRSRPAFPQYRLRGSAPGANVLA